MYNTMGQLVSRSIDLLTQPHTLLMNEIDLYYEQSYT